MMRTLMIYMAVLTVAEFSFGRKGHADEPQVSAPQGLVIYADMKPIKADGKDIPPHIFDFTKKADTSREVSRAD